MADALSQLPPIVHFAPLTIPPVLDITLINSEVANDPCLKKVIEQLKEDEDSVPKFSLTQGKLLYKGRLVLSKTSSLIPSILYTFHDSVMGGHSSFLRTYKRLARELYWKGMKNDTKNYVA